MGIVIPRQVAQAVCLVLGGSTADAVMAPQRGTPRTADLRAVAMQCWRLWQHPMPNMTETGAAFGRNRRNVARGIHRVTQKRVMPGKATLVEIRARLSETRVGLDAN